MPRIRPSNAMATKRLALVPLLVLVCALSWMTDAVHAQSRSPAASTRAPRSVGMGGFGMVGQAESVGTGLTLNLDLSQPIRFEMGRLWAEDRDDNAYSVRYTSAALRFWRQHPPGSFCSRYGHLGAGLYRYLLADSGYSSRLVKGFSLSTSLECTIRRAVLESSFSGRIADRVDHGLFGSGLFSLEFGLRLRLRF